MDSHWVAHIRSMSSVNEDQRSAICNPLEMDPFLKPFPLESNPCPGLFSAWAIPNQTEFDACFV